MVEQTITKLKPDLIQAIQECIRIPSVKDVARREEGAPFGPEVKEALEWSLALGRNLGFKVKNVDGYAGHIEMGEGEILGILGHLDVVPAGAGWSVPPFGGVVKEERIYGRGALDDKGPTLAALFAMKAIMDAGIPLHKKVRLILGTDEESGWADMDYYFQREETPALGFAPDAEFPLIHAEKGALHLALKKDYPALPHVVSLSGGERANIVPDVCHVVLDGIQPEVAQEKLRSFPFPEGVSATLSLKEEMCELLFRGVGAHGSLPQNGKNAVLYALRFLQELPLSLEEQSMVNWVLVHAGTGFAGEGFGLALEDEPSGKLSLNLGLCQMTAQSLRLVLDIRFPVTYSREDVLKPIRERSSPAGYTLEVLSEHPPHYVPKDSELVQALLRAYAEVTGLEPYAFAIGGGTYAKTMPQGVAFGPVFPGEPETVHCADEYIRIESLMKSTQVYAQAILNLASR